MGMVEYSQRNRELLTKERQQNRDHPRISERKIKKYQLSRYLQRTCKHEDDIIKTEQKNKRKTDTIEYAAGNIPDTKIS
ncbi:MAG: hypothetical protein IJ251_08045 [Oscillospiraceae bacterium]|nr:hypothetical protein [Oscillospiraceae bacterium]